MTRDPTDLHDTGRGRSPQSAYPANTNAPPSALDPYESCAVADQLLTPPAGNWSEIVDKVRFLLELGRASPQGQLPDVAKLIDRALGDMARMLQRQKEKG